MERNLTNMIPAAADEYHKWSIGQLNVQTCSDDIRLDLAIKECSRANLDIICLQEVRKLNTGSIVHCGYSFYWCGLKRLKRSGVAIAIRNCPYIKIESVLYVDARLMAVDLSVKGFRLRIISSYAPALSNSYSSKQVFYRELVKLSKTDKGRHVLIQGDFNAEFEISRKHSRFDGSISDFDDGLNQTNENAILFFDHCRNNKLSLLNTWFVHPLRHRITWHSPDGVTKKVYDYSISGSWLRRFVQDVRVRNSYFHSDHRLLVTKMRTPTNKSARFIQRKRRKFSSKPNLQLLQLDNTVKSKVLSETQKFLNDNNCPQTLDAIHDHIIEAMDKGRKCIPSMKRNRSNRNHWQQDQILSELYNKRINLKSRQETPPIKQQLKDIRHQINARIKTITNKTLEEKGKGLNELKEQRKITKLWRTAKKHGTNLHSKPKSIQCPGLAKHFKDHFNPNHSTLFQPPELDDPPEFIQLLRNPNLEINNSPPSQEEISAGIKQLNSGKATYDMEAEIVKQLDDLESFRQHLETYFKEIWTKKQVPNAWRKSRITPIWKRKGSSQDPSKYRGISNSSVLSKIGINIILNRLSDFYNDQLMRSQFGFRSGMGCPDAIYMIKQLQEVAYVSNRSLYVCFVDLSAAFDHINREMLFKSVRNRLAANQITTNIDILENLYERTSSYLQAEDPHHDCFVTSSGVRQGGKEGPPLYNFQADYALRTFNHRKEINRIKGLSIPYNIPSEATDRAQRSTAPASGVCEDAEEAYADDSALFSWDKEELGKMMEILNQVFLEFGLNINFDKTETLVFNWDASNTAEYPDSLISISGNIINNSTEFKYLGVWLRYDDMHIGNPEIEHRVSSAFNTFATHKKLLTNFSIRLRTRIMFLNALVRSKLVYGCHAWRPNAQELSKLNSTYRHILRSMIRNGHRRVNPPRRTSGSTSDTSSEDSSDEIEYDWSYVINNQRLHSITETSSITEYYEDQQAKWMSHVIRRDNSNLCKILTFYSIESKRRGRRTDSILNRVVNKSNLSKSEFIRRSFNRINLR